MLKLEFKTWPYYNQNLSLVLTGFVHTMYINTTIEHFDSVTPKILKPTFLKITGCFTSKIESLA